MAKAALLPADAAPPAVAPAQEMTVPLDPIPPLDAKLSRRQVLAGMGGLALMAAGCARTTASSGSKVVKGGTLRGAIQTDLVPAAFYTNSSNGVTTVIGLVYEGLIRYPTNQVTPTPRLATSWHLSSDGTTLTLDLRRGVKYHTGRPFTSKDAEFSLQTYADPKWTGQEQSTAAAIADYGTSDPHKLVLRLKHPLSNIFDLLDTVPMVDKETFDGVGSGKQYVGTGPFKFVSWTANESLKFKKNEHYWRPGLPYLDAVDIAIVPDASSLTTQLRSGQIDYDYGSSYLDIKQLVRSGKYTSQRLVGAEDQIYVGCNVNNPTLSDLKVRQAIAYALDRERIMSEVFVGSGYAVNLPWPKYSPAYDAAKNRTYPYDPAKAKRLVQQHGKKIPSLPYAFPSGNPLYEATVQIVQSDLAAVGIPVSLTPMEPPDFTKHLIGAQFEGLWSTYHSWAQHTPSTLTVSAYPFNAAKNASHYSSAKYTRDALAAWKTPQGTSPQAKRAYAALSDDLLNALFLIEIGVVELQWAFNKRLHGVNWTKRSELVLTEAWLEH